MVSTRDVADFTKVRLSGASCTQALEAVKRSNTHTPRRQDARTYKEGPLCFPLRGGTNMRSNHQFLMKSAKWLLLVVCFACLVPGKDGRGRIAKVGTCRGDSRAEAASRARLAGNYGKIPLSFEANQGQTDARVK